LSYCRMQSILSGAPTQPQAPSGVWEAIMQPAPSYSSFA